MQNEDLKRSLKRIVEALNEVSVRGYQNRVILATCERDLMTLAERIGAEDADAGQEME